MGMLRFTPFTVVSITLAGTLAGTLAACAGLPKPVEKPTADVQGVSIESVNVTSVSGHVAIDVFNPNAFGVPLRRGTWNLSIGGAEAVSGEFDLAKTIPARATAPVLASLRIDAADAVVVGTHITAGERTYVVSGTLTFATQFGDIDVAYRHEGTIDDATGSANPMSALSPLVTARTRNRRP
jgi:LEA14-like dessication related protein